MKQLLKKFMIRFPASEQGDDAIVVNGLTDTGLVRGHNEDAYIVLHNEANLGNVDTVMRSPMEWAVTLPERLRVQ